MASKKKEKQWRANMLARNPNYFNDWYHANKDLTKRQKRRKTPKGKIDDLYDKIKQRQPDTDITKDWIKRRVERGYCQLTGVLFDYKVVGKRMPKCPSIDRINSNRGYFKNNCRLILCWLNIAKQDMPNNYFLKLIKESAKTI